MVESFSLGMATALLMRMGVMRSLKWPLLSRPLLIVPEMLLGGLFLSLFDYSRRVALENLMKREEMIEIAEIMRKSELNYGSHAH